MVSRGRVWLPSTVGMGLVAAQMVLAFWGGGIAQPLLVTATIGLGIGAAAVTMLWSMGLRHESLTARLMIAAPIVLSVGLAVVLMLDANFRRWEIRPE